MIVPVEITVNLLLDAMKKAGKRKAARAMIEKIARESFARQKRVYS